MDKEISDQVQRLYAAAKELRGVEGKSAVARLINVSPQTLNNWEGGRPISNEGLLISQEVIGCDAIWLRDGIGQMVKGENVLNGNTIAELIILFSNSTQQGREMILDFARSTEKTVGAFRSNGSVRRGNKP